MWRVKMLTKKKRSFYSLDPNVHKIAEVLLITQRCCSQRTIDHIAGSMELWWNLSQGQANDYTLIIWRFFQWKASQGEEVGFKVMVEVEISCFWWSWVGAWARSRSSTLSARSWDQRDFRRKNPLIFGGIEKTFYILSTKQGARRGAYGEVLHMPGNGTSIGNTLSPTLISN